MLMLYTILPHIENTDKHTFSYLLVTHLIVNNNTRKYDFSYIFKVSRACHCRFLVYLFLNSIAQNKGLHKQSGPSK